MRLLRILVVCGLSAHFCLADASVKGLGFVGSRGDASLLGLKGSRVAKCGMGGSMLRGETSAATMMTLAKDAESKNGVANKVALVALGCPKNTVDAEVGDFLFSAPFLPKVPVATRACRQAAACASQNTLPDHTQMQVMLGDLQRKGFDIVRKPAGAPCPEPDMAEIFPRFDDANPCHAPRAISLSLSLTLSLSLSLHDNKQTNERTNSNGCTCMCNVQTALARRAGHDSDSRDAAAPQMPTS